MRLISFLGTGHYQPVDYCLESDSKCCKTPYVAAALACLLPAEEVVILATEQAEKTHREALVQELTRLGKNSPEWVRICDGKSRAELWDNFNRLVDLLTQSKAEQVVLDITHGFRSQPFFAGAVVSFVRAIEGNLSPIRVVYGAFEARDANDRAPIWDLTAFVELLDWTQAIRAFLSSGLGQELATKAEDLGKRLAKAWAEHKQGRAPQVKKFASALRAFSQALTTVRTGELLLARGKHLSAVKWLAQAVQEAAVDFKAYIPPMVKVLEQIQAMLQPLLLEQNHLSGPEGQRAMANLARLYLQLGRYAEAGIILREGWVNLYATPEATCPGEGFDPQGRQIAEQRLAKAGHVERELMGLRNDLEHGGFRKKPLTAKTVFTKLEQFIKEFEQAQPVSIDEEQPIGTIWLVTRHPEAVEWAKRQKILVDRWVEHLDVEQVRSGDVVIGTLPIHLAASVCERGARFINLSLDVPQHARGRELSADDMEYFQAKLEEYRIVKGKEGDIKIAARNLGCSRT